METFEDSTRRGGTPAIREASRFFMQEDAVYETLRDITRRLDKLATPYAVIGGMALVAHGYRRTTEDVDVLVKADDIDKIHKALSGLGYLPIFKGSKAIRNTKTGVRVEFVLTGQYPGDGKPKPVAFPDPASVTVSIDEICYITLPALAELKLASGMTNPGRLRDLADVQELIRVLNLRDDFADQLDPYVRPEFLRLLAGIADGADM